MAEGPKVFRLACSWQDYMWGKVGGESEVAQLLAASEPGFQLDDKATYAELWMGTHSKWPSSIHGTQEALEDWLSEHPDAYGSNIISKFGHKLPFLLKVLSINRVLEIQAHPNQELAAQLHAQDPVTYLDPNHKPEMCLALTPFRGMCGFRPIAEIAEFLQEIQELVNVVGRSNADNLIATSKTSDKEKQERAIKSCFAALMRQDQDVVSTELRKLIQRVKELDEGGQDTGRLYGRILQKLNREFPDDAGCFCLYLLNVINLQPGEAMFIAAGVIHAYFEGECMECLASGDNVLFGGLTHKPKAIDTLLGMLKYEGRPEGDFRLLPVTTNDGGCIVEDFSTPVDDFSLMRIQVPGSQNSCNLSGLDSASIVLCVQGQGTVSNNTMKSPIKVGRGVVIFIAANEDCQIKADSDMLMFRAYC